MTNEAAAMPPSYTAKPRPAYRHGRNRVVSATAASTVMPIVVSGCARRGAEALCGVAHGIACFPGVLAQLARHGAQAALR
jgi:hypothetical protein